MDIKGLTNRKLFSTPFKQYRTFLEPHFLIVYTIFLLYSWGVNHHLSCSLCSRCTHTEEWHFNTKCQYGIHTTMVNYRKTTSRYIYRHWFTECIGKNRKKHQWSEQMTANEFVGASEKMNWKYREKKFRYSILQHHACIFLYIYMKSPFIVINFCLASHSGEKLPCTKIITQWRFIIIFYNDILKLNGSCWVMQHFTCSLSVHGRCTRNNYFKTGLTKANEIQPYLMLQIAWQALYLSHILWFSWKMSIFA